MGCEMYLINHKATFLYFHIPTHRPKPSEETAYEM